MKTEAPWGQTVASLEPRTVQAHSGYALMFAEWRQERDKGYRAWPRPPGVLKVRQRSRTIHVVWENAGRGFRKGYCPGLEWSGGLHGGAGGSAGPGRPRGFTESLTLRAGRVQEIAWPNLLHL